MAESMSVEAILSAVDENFTKTMESAVDSLSKVMQANQQASSGMIRSGAMMGAAAVVTGKAIGVIKDSLGGAISRFDTLNKYPVVMNALGYSTRDVAKSSQILQKGIDGLPTSLDEITGIAQQLGPLTGGANKAAKSAIALNNAFLASGASVADTSRGLQQYTQMLSTGKVDLMSYRTLMETMPIALRKVANSFGFTGKSAEQDLYSALQSGQITVDQLNDRFIKLNGGVNGFASLARKNSQGIATSFANLKNAVVKNMANMLTAINQGFQQAGFGSIAQVLDNMKVAINASFAVIAPIVTNATKVILVGLKSLIGFVNQNKDWLTPLTVGILTFVGQVKVIKGAITIFGQLETASKVFKTIKKASDLETAVKGLDDLAESLKLAAAAQTALNIAQSLSPMTWLIVGIVAVVAALAYFFTQTKTGRQLWSNFINWLKGALTGFQQFWQNLNNAIVQIFTEIWNALGQQVGAIVASFKAAWNGVAAFFSGLWQGIVSAASAAWNGLVTVASTVWNAIRSVVSTIWGGTVSVVRSIGASLRAFWNGMMNGLRSVVSSVWGTIKGVFSAGMGFIKSVVHVDLSGAGRAIMNSFLNGLKSAWESVKSFVGNIARWIKRHKGPISYDRKLLIPAGQAIMQGLNAGLTDGFGIVQDNVSTMAGRIQSLVANTQNGYAAGLSNLNSSMTSTIAGTMTIENNAQQNRIAQLLEAIANKDTTMVMDSGALVGATAGAYDRNLGQNVALNGRWS